MKLFYSGTYCVRHELITRKNVKEMLKEDIRSKIVGNVEDTIYASKGVVLKDNPNVTYIGGFYYEKKHKNKSICESVVLEELKQIDQCDIVVANLMNYSAIATVTEIIYAATKGKKIIIFCDPDITSYEVTGEYWFPILTAKECTSQVEVIYTKEEDDIVQYIHNLGKEERIFLEGTDGVGKTETIKGLKARGIICQDREKTTISKNMVFEISLEERARIYSDYLKKNNVKIIFMINNDSKELLRRIQSRREINEFDRNTCKYNKLYKETYEYMSKKNLLQNKLFLVDCTNKSLSEQIDAVAEIIYNGDRTK